MFFKFVAQDLMMYCRQSVTLNKTNCLEKGKNVKLTATVSGVKFYR